MLFAEIGQTDLKQHDGQQYQGQGASKPRSLTHITNEHVHHFYRQKSDAVVNQKIRCGIIPGIITGIPTCVQKQTLPAFISLAASFHSFRTFSKAGSKSRVPIGI